MHRTKRWALALCFALLCGCAGKTPKSEDPLTLWHQMQLPVKIANARVSSTQAQIFDRFKKAVQSQDYKKALALLQDPGLDAQGKPWADVLAGQLAGLHTQACEGGQWLYFGDPKKPSAPRVSMLSVLDKLDALRDSNDKTLATQAKVASIRVMVIARDCPGARTVQERAQTELPALLEDLFHSQALTPPPDLAYYWALQQLEKEEWAKARQWLVFANAQGMKDPRLTLALAQVDYGAKAYDRALQQAVAGAKAIPKDFRQAIAEAWTLAAKSAWALGNTKLATQHRERALKAEAAHPGAWALGVRMLSAHDESCESTLPVQLARLWKLSWAKEPTLFWLLDDMLATLDAEAPEALPCLARALVWDIDQEQDPALRGIRYFYAATLDTRLGDFERALGRALLARSEFESAGSPRHPLPVQALIDALSEERSSL